jgi:uncharacterized membrane protein (UPF0127 family)
MRPDRPAVLLGPNGVVADHVRWATTFRTRRRGLRGSVLGPREALIIEPCRQVHTFGVPEPIDVVFCDARWNVVHVQTLAPRRLSRPVLRARSCIELPAHRAREAAIHPGARLELREPS